MTTTKKAAPRKKSTFHTIKTGAKVAKIVVTSKYIQGGAKILFATTVGVYLRHRTMEKEGIL